MIHALPFALAVIFLTIISGRNKGIYSIPEFSRSHTNMLRGLSMLLIICHHISGIFIDQWQRLLTPMGGVGVAVFLVISGYGINESYKKHGLKHFWLKKLLRVFLPCFLFELIVYYICLDHFDTTSLSYIILDITCLRSRLWFVSFILYMYVIYYVSTRWIYKYRLLVMAVCGIAILLLLKGVEGEQGFSFMVGVLISEKKETIIPYLTKHGHGLSVMLLTVGFFFLAIKQLPIIRAFSETAIYNAVQTMIKLPLALALILVTLKATWLQRNRFMSFCGKISYELYIVHITVFFGLIGTAIPHNWTGLVIASTASFIFSWLFYRYNQWFSRMVMNKINRQ